MKYFIHLAYKGTRFHGWQSQKDVNSVQSTLKNAISTLLRKDTSIMGCGRTDAGVHALQYFAHFRSDSELGADFTRKLNRFLTSEIVIYDLVEVKNNAHVQKGAISRQYDYLFSFKKQVFLHDLVAVYDEQVFDLEKAKQAVKILVGEHDFKCFCTNPHEYDHTRCNVFDAAIHYNENEDIYQLSIKANRFLKSMVRLIVGRVIDVAVEKLSLDDFKLAILQLKEFKYNKPAYAKGLFLAEVKYPFLNINPSRKITQLFS